MNIRITQSHLFKICLVALFTLLFVRVNAQNGAVGIGTRMPDSSSVLDVVSQTRGVLLPRVHITDTTLPTPISGTPAEGLLIYNNGYIAGEMTSGNGFYYWTKSRGGRWIFILPYGASGVRSDSLLADNYINISGGDGSVLKKVKMSLNLKGLSDSILSKSYFKDSIASIINTKIVEGNINGQQLSAGSNKVTVTGGIGATLKAASVDVNEANLNLANIGGTLPVTKMDTTTLKTRVSNWVTTAPVKDSITSVINNQITAGAVTGKDITSTSGGALVITGGAGTSLKATSIAVNKDSIVTSTQVSKVLGISPSKDTLLSVVNSQLSAGTVTGKDLTAGSNKLTVTNGTGAMVKAASVDVNEANLNLANIGGTLPLTKVAAGGATNGQVLQYNGTNWVAATPSTSATNVTGAADVTAGSNKVTLGGTPTGATLKAFSVDVNEANLNLANIGGTLPITKVSSTGATSGQVLGFNGTTMVWTTPSTTATSVPASGVTSAADVTAGSNKVTLGGTPTGATLKAFSVDVNEANLNLANIGGTLPVTKMDTTALKTRVSNWVTIAPIKDSIISVINQPAVKDSIRLATRGLATNIVVVNNANYIVASDDYTIVVKSMTADRTVSLPPPTGNKGRILKIVQTTAPYYLYFNYNIYYSDTDIYNYLYSPIGISSATNYKITIQSDGNQWYAIENQ